MIRVLNEILYVKILYTLQAQDPCFSATVSSLSTGLYSWIVADKHVTCLVRPFPKPHPSRCVLAEPMPGQGGFVSPDPIQYQNLDTGSKNCIFRLLPNSDLPSPILSDDGE